MLTTSKYWLQAENDRNTRHGQVFIDLIKRAFGVDEVVMVGHHFVFEPQAAMTALDLTKLNEIPSADTMLFDHDIMTEVFGDKALGLMTTLAQHRAEERDEIVRQALLEVPPKVVTPADHGVLTLATAS